MDTPLAVSLTGAQTSNITNNISTTFQAGDSISLKVTVSTLSTIADTVIQVDIF
ncbi:hypothetical protein bthur0010_59910 [Bacillus thuringiensis serovar pondicheriensis BGSC 4BA1]|nr:hypothetical protein bthur0010_59910 [Bacillus thuringiensis serovar pondicheriensis BGSC 4BA1]